MHLDRYFITIITLCFISFSGFSQQIATEYPKVTGYMGLVHPIVTVNQEETVWLFAQSYTVGFPVGINFLKNEKIGFSTEFVPFINARNNESKMSNFLFHPGVMFRFKKGLTLVTRLAFETSGRYGFTPVINKVVKRNKNSNYFIAVPLPVRFGNNRSTSFTVGFQFGIGF
jgi:uncharacterized protein YneR